MPMTQLPPILRQVVVPAPVEVAFAVVTDQIGRWWPVGDGFSVHGAQAEVAFAGGRLVERAGAGAKEAVWGRSWTGSLRTCSG
jgi:uncharacterized protein YndB with AHSA1/START domain